MDSCLRGACFTRLWRNKDSISKINTNVIKRWRHIESVENTSQPKKFTTSKAYVDYRATDNYFSSRNDLPRSHNAVITITGIFGFAYLIFLRDDIEQDGGKNLIKPVYEIAPHLAIPILKSAIRENRKFGNDTSKLEAKLAEFMNEPEKYGQPKKRMVEN